MLLLVQQKAACLAEPTDMTRAELRADSKAESSVIKLVVVLAGTKAAWLVDTMADCWAQLMADWMAGRWVAHLAARMVALMAAWWCAAGGTSATHLSATYAARHCSGCRERVNGRRCPICRRDA